MCIGIFCCYNNTYYIITICIDDEGLYYSENDSADIIDDSMMMFLVFTAIRTFGNNKQSKAHVLYNIIMKRNRKIDYSNFDELSIQPSISNCQMFFHDARR